MHTEFFDNLLEKVKTFKVIREAGKVVAVEGGQIVIAQLNEFARIGDIIKIDIDRHRKLETEVVRMNDAHVYVMPDGDITGLQLGAWATLYEERTIAPNNSWIGRVIDPHGKPLDEEPLYDGLKDHPLRKTALPAGRRRGFGPRLRTGSFALNTLLPLVHGQRLGLFAGSGVGKSTLLGTLAQFVECDVAVIALIGERGRELRHFTDAVLGPDGMKKSVVVAATSDKSALERRRCAWTAMSVAEYFRDQGKSVLFLADSITRFAEAHREVATTAGELPVLQGYPPSTAQMITELCERAGPGIEGTGDITAVFSVLVAGSDMEEPIADILRGVLDGHVVLTRDIAERGRYPAIDLLASVSRSLPEAASNEENQLISKVREISSLYENNALMVRSGLYTAGTDPELDTAVKVWPELDDFIGTCAPNSPNDCFDKLRLIFRRAGIET